MFRFSLPPCCLPPRCRSGERSSAAEAVEPWVFTSSPASYDRQSTATCRWASSPGVGPASLFIERLAAVGALAFVRTGSYGGITEDSNVNVTVVGAGVFALFLGCKHLLLISDLAVEPRGHKLIGQ